MIVHNIRATTIAKSLSLADIERKLELVPTQKKRNSLLYVLGPNQYLVVYYFGVAVIAGLDEKESGRLIRRLAKLAREPVAHPVTEDYQIQEDSTQPEGVEFDFVRVRLLDTVRFLVIAEILAQSVAIEDTEEQVNDIMERFDKIHYSLEKRGKLKVSTAEIMKVIGTNSHILEFVIGKLAVLDKPDVTWEDKDIENIFHALRKMFELEDRFRSLEFKLNFVQNNSELVLDVLQNRRSGRLEIIIILLIAFEILLFVYDLFITKSG